MQQQCLSIVMPAYDDEATLAHLFCNLEKSYRSVPLRSGVVRAE